VILQTRDLAMAEALAVLHAQALPPAWSASAYAAYLADPACFIWIDRAQGEEAPPSGFLLVRGVLDEAEILMLCVAPQAQGRGVGRALLRHAIAALSAQAFSMLYLEVAADNAPARGLYAKMGFAQTGVRSGYYVRPGQTAQDALLLSLRLDSITSGPHI
jgi:[ribosomal protein S18]-alanine N-acetyltransferase